MNHAKFAYDNGFGIGFNTNKVTTLYEWYVRCNECKKQEALPDYTASAYKIGPYPNVGERNDSEIAEFFSCHVMCIK